MSSISVVIQWTYWTINMSNTFQQKHSFDLLIITQYCKYKVTLIWSNAGRNEVQNKY